MPVPDPIVFGDPDVQPRRGFGSLPLGRVTALLVAFAAVAVLMGIVF